MTINNLGVEFYKALQVIPCGAFFCYTDNNKIQAGYTMSLTERINQLIESHENRIRDYESRIEKMEKEISKNRGGIDEYHSFIELEKEQIAVLKKFLSFGSDYLETLARIVRSG